jgi:hypothetical protein
MQKFRVCQARANRKKIALTQVTHALARFIQKIDAHSGAEYARSPDNWAAQRLKCAGKIGAKRLNPASRLALRPKIAVGLRLANGRFCSRIVTTGDDS